jgi:hypothetical protein
MADSRTPGWTLPEAQSAAMKINNYWVARGFLSEAHVERTCTVSDNAWVIRTNCINGIPTRRL